ncbi:MAG: sialidase family protein, partial [Bacteroidia bacterium]
MRTFYLLFASFFVLFQTRLTAQPPNVRVNEYTYDGECTILINPANPNNIIGACNPDWIFRTIDGGLTWSVNHMNNFATTNLIGDVTLACDDSGHWYYQDLDDNLLFHNYYSSDEGLTWGRETFFGEPNLIQDKNWLVADRVPSSPYNGRVYCAWTRRNDGINPGCIFFNSTSDQGYTWSQRDTLVLYNSLQPPIGTGLAVSPNGDINVSWAGGYPNRIQFKKSTDGGSTWPSPVTVIDTNVQPVNQYYASILHAISYSAQFTSLACDQSNGPHSGNLYCVWDDIRNGAQNADIFLARSTDGGATWNTQRVNNDTSTRNQVVPTVAVDPTSGWVYVAYLDARLNIDIYDDTLHYYLAWSTDGGATFNTIRVSQNPSVCGAIHSDYMGMDAHSGKCALMWGSCPPTENTETWFAMVDQTFLSANSSSVNNAANGPMLFPAYPNPSLDFTTFDFEV